MAIVGDYLKTRGRERLDTELLLAFVLGKERSFVLAHPEKKLSDRQDKRLGALIARRKIHEPLAYILGEKEFFGKTFSVNRFTLIPRPETEHLVEKAIEEIKKVLVSKKKQKIAIIDVGTGSGAIIVSIAEELVQQPQPLSFFASDISERALKVARKNSERHGLKNVFFAKGDLLKPLIEKLTDFDTLFLLANLPYLSEKLYASTPPDVRNFEPVSALLSGKDGLDHYRKLFTQISLLKRPREVSFFLEISPEQEKMLSKAIRHAHTVFPDLSGRARLATGHFSIP
ncbi:MAG: peptide chain release factor N(5)-glutamine methyltransferase [Candidatus Moraniibacteriota bacterium]